MRRLTAALFLALLAGCPGDLDFPDQVKDLRVLAMRLDPPELTLPLAPLTQPLNVQATVLLADPERQHVEIRVSGCPEPDAEACANFRPEEDPETYPDPAVYDSLREVTALQADIPAAPQIPDLTFDFARSYPPDLIDELMSRAPLGGLGGARPALQINAYAGERRETAYKRLQINYSDAFYRVVLAGVGVPICDVASTEPECGDGEVPPGCCFEYRTRFPNTNPTFEALGVRRETLEGPDGEITTVNPNEPIEVIPGEQIRFFPKASDDSLESYQTLGVDIGTQEIFVTDLDELLVFTWFTSEGGLFELFRTESEDTLGVDNLYTAPGQSGDSYIWIVLRDTRGGVDWRTVHIVVTPL